MTAEGLRKSPTKKWSSITKASPWAGGEAFTSKALAGLDGGEAQSCHPHWEPLAPTHTTLRTPPLAEVTGSTHHLSKNQTKSLPSLYCHHSYSQRARGAAYLSSEIEEEGDAADHLSQPQQDEGGQKRARGGRRVRVWRQRRRWRRRRGALVGGAAAHLLGAAQVFGVVSAGAPHGAAGTPLGRLHTRLHGAPRPRQTTPPPRAGKLL